MKALPGHPSVVYEVVPGGHGGPLILRQCLACGVRDDHECLDAVRIGVWLARFAWDHSHGDARLAHHWEWEFHRQVVDWRRAALAQGRNYY